jgi:hypothetical protein
VRNVAKQNLFTRGTTQSRAPSINEKTQSRAPSIKWFNFEIMLVIHIIPKIRKEYVKATNHACSSTTQGVVDRYTNLSFYNRCMQIDANPAIRPAYSWIRFTTIY